MTTSLTEQQAAEVTRAIIDRVAEISDLLWTSILLRVPSEVAELLRAHDEAQASVINCGDAYSSGRSLTPEELAGVQQAERAAVAAQQLIEPGTKR